MEYGNVNKRSSELPDGTAGRRRPSAWVLVVSAVALLLVLGVVVAHQRAEHHPTDAEMRAWYGTHRAALSELVRRVRSTGATGELASDWIDIEPLPATEEVEWMRREIQLLGLVGALTIGREEIILCLSAHGLLEGSTKGLAFRSSPPVTVVPELDNIDTHQPPGGTAYVALENGWYLYLEWNI